MSATVYQTERMAGIGRGFAIVGTNTEPGSLKVEGRHDDYVAEYFIFAPGVAQLRFGSRLKWKKERVGEEYPDSDLVDEMERTAKECAEIDLNRQLRKLDEKLYCAIEPPTLQEADHKALYIHAKREELDDILNWIGESDVPDVKDVAEKLQYDGPMTYEEIKPPDNGS